MSRSFNGFRCIEMRARNIKPGFFVNADLVECDPLARILFAGLWCLADKEGRLEDRPNDFKLKLLPGDTCDVDSLLGQLCSRNFVSRYAIGNKRYIQINTFAIHQNPHKNEKPSSIPQPASDNVDKSLDNNGSSNYANNPVNDGTGRADSLPLIPDPLTSDTNVSGEASSPEVDFKKIIFDEGLKFVASRSGKAVATLRPLFGKWCKDYGEARVAAAIVEAQKTSAVEPVSWIVKFLQGDGSPRRGLHSGFVKQDFTAGLEGFDVA